MSKLDVKGFHTWENSRAVLAATFAFDIETSNCVNYHGVGYTSKAVMEGLAKGLSCDRLGGLSQTERNLRDVRDKSKLFVNQTRRLDAPGAEFRRWSQAHAPSATRFKDRPSCKVVQQW